MSRIRRRHFIVIIGAAAAVLLACAGLGTPLAPTSTAPVPIPTLTPIALATETPRAPTPAPTAPLLAGYYAGWAAARYPVAAIPADELTHVLYAFASVSASGECVPADPVQDQANFQALALLKQAHPRLQVLISVGGWSGSGLFSDVAATPPARAHFAQSCAAFVQAHGFDGLDVDWEFPVSGGLPANHYRPADGHNFTLLLAELRRALDAQGQADGRHYALTIAAPAGPGEYAHLELGLIHPDLDWINLMTYDFYTADSPTTNFNAPLFAAPDDPSPPARRQSHNADAAVQGYLAAGVPARKLLLGAPLYGRGWQGVPPANDGLYQPDTGPAQSAFANAGTFTYADLESHYLPASAYPRHFQSDAQVPWLYNPTTQIFITYEDPQSLGAKADYVLSHGLGGLMFWELSQDDAQHTLVAAMHAHLMR